MPALTLRGRYLMREYWSDSSLFMKLDAAERELYIGLWMLADDKGWLSRDVTAIAASLYRYEDSGLREGRVRAGLRHLGRLGKVESYRCGHLHLPAVERYPRAGNKTFEHYAVHAQHIKGRSKKTNDIQPGLNPSPVPTGSNPSIPVVAREENKKDEESEFERKVPRPAAIAAERRH